MICTEVSGEGERALETLVAAEYLLSADGSCSGTVLKCLSVSKPSRREGSGPWALVFERFEMSQRRCRGAKLSELFRDPTKLF